MAYEYDIFLSYKTGYPFGDWVDVFLELFQPLLEGEFGKDVVLFRDREAIKGGDTLPPKLQHALARSKCLVCIWTAQYFRSAWCQRELHVMLKREQMLGYRTNARPSGLIVPFRLHDGQHFPPFTNQIKQFDCIHFGRLVSRRKTSETYERFYEEMQEWVKDVAEVLRQAPDWQPAWDNDTSFTDDIGYLLQGPQTIFPGLNG